jgi:uncharacterized protein (DUF3820 family)
MFKFKMGDGLKSKVVDLDTYNEKGVETLFYHSKCMDFYFSMELRAIRLGLPRSIGKVGRGQYHKKMLCDVPEGYLRVYQQRAYSDSGILYRYLCARKGIPIDGFDNPVEDWNSFPQKPDEEWG